MNPIHHGAWVACPNCRIGLDIQPDTLSDYFSNPSSTCQNCNQPVDLWLATIAWIQEWFAMGSALMLSGARATLLSVPLIPGGTTTVDLVSQAGIPEQAEIVSLNLTGSNSLPHLVHGNEAIRQPFGPKFAVFGFPIPDPPPEIDTTKSGPLQVYAIWFVRSGTDAIVRHLIDAARQFGANNFDGVVIPANIAAEAAITPVVSLALADIGTTDSRKAFLRDGATYSHQLNFLLQLVAEHRGLARLPEPIRVALNRLRKLRNEMGHSGTCAPQTKPEAAQHLASAIFGVAYARYIAKEITNPKAALSSD
jgi:hypothetical protein